MSDSRFAQEHHPHLAKMRERLAKLKREERLSRLADREIARERRMALIDRLTQDLDESKDS